MYEFCLEYGTFPISIRNDEEADLKAIPIFLEGEPQLLAELQALNTEFHELFIEIECHLDYIGREKPEKVHTIRQEYERISQIIADKFPKIIIEPFYAQ